MKIKTVPKRESTYVRQQGLSFKVLELNDYSYIKSITGNILDFNQNNDDVKGNINLNIKYF